MTMIDTEKVTGSNVKVSQGIASYFLNTLAISWTRTLSLASSHAVQRYLPTIKLSYTLTTKLNDYTIRHCYTVCVFCRTNFRYCHVLSYFVSVCVLPNSFNKRMSHRSDGNLNLVLSWQKFRNVPSTRIKYTYPWIYPQMSMSTATLLITVMLLNCVWRVAGRGWYDVHSERPVGKVGSSRRPDRSQRWRVARLLWNVCASSETSQTVANQRIQRSGTLTWALCLHLQNSS